MVPALDSQPRKKVGGPVCVCACARTRAHAHVHTHACPCHRQVGLCRNYEHYCEFGVHQPAPGGSKVIIIGQSESPGTEDGAVLRSLGLRLQSAKQLPPVCVRTGGEDSPPTHSWETQPAAFPPSEAQVESVTLGVDPSEDSRRCQNVNAVVRGGTWFTSQNLAQAWPKVAVLKVFAEQNQRRTESDYSRNKN